MNTSEKHAAISIGYKIGKWTVIEASRLIFIYGQKQTAWKTQCSCGTTRYMTYSDITKKQPQSCKKCRATRYVCMVGQKFNFLTVLNILNERDKFGHVQCEAQCECGKIKIMSCGNIEKGLSKSCGCFHIKQVKAKLHLPNKMGLFNKLITIYQRAAKDRNICCDLTIEQFKSFFLNKCYYCGAEPSTIKNGDNTFNESLYYNGIDRVDNSKGYVFSNCVTACKKCNMDKNRVSIKIARKMIEFIDKGLHT